LIALADDYFSVPEETHQEHRICSHGRRRTIVHATEEFAPHNPPPISVLPEWSPVAKFGGYGASLDVCKAARAGVPVEHKQSGPCHQHECAHALHQLFATAEAVRNRYVGFWGMGCDCFAF